jgi:nitrogen fixation-related uncharacterized protein
MKRLKQDKTGISNVIVVMLSLVLIVIIVANVVLWSYQMNQFDLERMQENTALTNVERITRSSWSTSAEEYTVTVGNRVSGTYRDTWSVDDAYETFEQLAAPTNMTTSSYRLDINGVFLLDKTMYPLSNINSVEVQLRYRATDSTEKWFLRAYDWTKGQYTDAGFNSTAGDSPTSQFRYYAVNMTNSWQSYVSNNGTVRIEFCNLNRDSNQTIVDVDFLGVRAIINGARFSIRNEGPLTSHIVAIWIVNSTIHERYDANFFLNSGVRTDYLRPDVALPMGNFTAKIVTERGNIAVFSG